MGVTPKVKGNMTRQIQEKHPLIQVLIDLGLSMANVYFCVAISDVPLSGFGEMDPLMSLNSPNKQSTTNRNSQVVPETPQN